MGNKKEIISYLVFGVLTTAISVISFWLFGIVFGEQNYLINNGVSKDRIIHINLEDMDYFRPSALRYKQTGSYTNLRPNPNPNSEYGKWIREEIRRCYEGYVRESDGEWVTGNMYFFMNYCPIPMTKITGKSKKGERVIDFPEFWEGIYYRFHYIE